LRDIQNYHHLIHSKKLFIVDESYTSRTCTNCGVINDTKGKETLKCKSCDFSIVTKNKIIDKDVV